MNYPRQQVKRNNEPFGSLRVQKKPAGLSPFPQPETRHYSYMGNRAAERLHSNNGMPEHVRFKMEQAFQTDFSGVKIHTNSSKASKLDALAYTRGSDIHFAPGMFKPGTDSGQRLLGHELAHVVQQRQGRVGVTNKYMGQKVNEDPRLEHEADRLGAMASRFRESNAPGNAPGNTPAHAPAPAQTQQPVIHQPVIQGVLTRSKVKAIKEADSIDDILYMIAKYPQLHDEIRQYIAENQGDIPILQELEHGYGDFDKYLKEEEIELGGNEEIEELIDKLNIEAATDTPEDAAEEMLNHNWHDEDRADATEEDVEPGDLDPNLFDEDEYDEDAPMQMARKGNTITGPKSYKTKNVGQYKNVAYKTDNLGSIDFSKALANRSRQWKNPVLTGTRVNLNQGIRQKGYGLMGRGKKVKIVGASRSQHFAIADRLLASRRSFKNFSRQSKYTWHHLKDQYKMELVDMTVHAKHGHNGGVYLW